MGDSGSKDAAAGLAAHSRDAVRGLKASTNDETDRGLTEAADSAQEVFKALMKLVRERPLSALACAATFGWLVGRIGKYV